MTSLAVLFVEIAIALNPSTVNRMSHLADRFCQAKQTVGELPKCSSEMSPDECQVFKMTNVIRSRCRLTPLKASPRCVKAARDHTKDMAKRNYFDHVSPTGSTPSQRMEKRGIQSNLYAENIAWDSANDLSAIMKGWMESRGHRENILDPKVTFLGTGTSRGKYRGDRGFFWNQCFHAEALAEGQTPPVARTNTVSRAPTHEGDSLLPLFFIGGAVATGIILFTNSKDSSSSPQQVKPPKAPETFCSGCGEGIP